MLFPEKTRVIFLFAYFFSKLLYKIRQGYKKLTSKSLILLYLLEVLFYLDILVRFTELHWEKNFFPATVLYALTLT